MSGVVNTGISGYIGNQNAREFQANSLTIDIFGNVFYRNYIFGASDDVGVFWNETKPFSDKAMLFIAAVLQKSLKGRFDFGNKLRASKSHGLPCPLPVHKNGCIALEFMQVFIKAVQKEVIKNVVLYTDKKLAAYALATS